MKNYYKRLNLLYNVFNSTLLNIFLGMFGGFLINIYTANPDDFSLTVILISCSIIFAVILIIINDFITARRGGGTLEVGWEKTKRAFEEMFFWVKYVYPFFILAFIGLFSFGIYNYVSKSISLKDKEPNLTEIKMQIDSLQSKIEKQNQILLSVRDSAISKFKEQGKSTFTINNSLKKHRQIK